MEPNYLFLVGAPKAGTTTLAVMLGQHPHVCTASVKEPRYFTDVLKKTWVGPDKDVYVAAVPKSREAWLGLFSDKPEARWRVDATTDYLSMSESAGLISAFADEVGREKVLVAAVVRDPVARAISEYRHTRRDAHQSVSLRSALRLEPERIEQGYISLFYHVRRSRYADDVERYRRLFGERFLVLDYHRLEEALERLRQAMGLEDDASPSPMVRANVSFTPRSMTIRRIIRSPKANRWLGQLLGETARKVVMTRLEHFNTSGSSQVAERDIRFLREALADDIARCKRDAGIPTEHWTLASLPAEFVQGRAMK